MTGPDAARKPRERRPRPAPLHALVLRGSAAGVLAYVLDGAPYALCFEGDAAPHDLPERHALALGYDGVRPADAPDARAERQGRVALALHALAHGAALDEAGRAALREEAPGASELLVHADGSFDPHDDALGVAYTLNGRPHALALPAPDGANGARAEREAVRVALLHARELAPERVTLRSDHVFHVRRYTEDLAHRGRRQSPSLERLDALVRGWGDRLRFEYVPTGDSDAAHRLATHARALRRLALGRALSRAQTSALRRVHHALRSPVPVPF